MGTAHTRCLSSGTAARFVPAPCNADSIMAIAITMSATWQTLLENDGSTDLLQQALPPCTTEALQQ